METVLSFTLGWRESLRSHEGVGGPCVHTKVEIVLAFLQHDSYTFTRGWRLSLNSHESRDDLYVHTRGWGRFLHSHESRDDLYVHTRGWGRFLHSHESRDDLYVHTIGWGRSLRSHEGGDSLVPLMALRLNGPRFTESQHPLERHAKLLTHDVVKEEISGTVNESQEVHDVTPFHVALPVNVRRKKWVQVNKNSINNNNSLIWIEKLSLKRLSLKMPNRHF